MITRWACIGILLVATAKIAVADDAYFSTGLLPERLDALDKTQRTQSYRSYLPEKVDLTDRLPKPGNQGNQGSCVGWAVGYAARAYYVARDGKDLSDFINIPSPAYIYNSIREGAAGCDEGSRIIDALILLKNRGVGSLKQYPYSASRCAKLSDVGTISSFQIEGYSLVDTKRLDQVKGELAKGNPVILALRTRRDFHRLASGQTYRMNASKETGSHAITAVGYDERRQAVKLINSWGRNWADGGYAWIDYSTLSNEASFGFVMKVPESKPSPISPNPEPVPIVTPKPAPVTPTPHSKKPSCSSVQTQMIRGEKIVVGFVGSDEEREALKLQYPGREIRADVRPWPQCEVLLTLDNPLKASSGIRASIRRDEKGALASGELLVFDVETPSYPSYLHVAYVQADGSVSNLIQSDPFALRTVAPRSRITLGDGSGGYPRIRVSKPFGREMLVVLASRSPLFPETRPRVETEREFLTALRRAIVAKPDPASPDRIVSAAFDSVITAE